MPTPNKTKLFVYGTLKRGHMLHRVYMLGSTFLGEDKARGTIYFPPGFSYPVAYPDSQEFNIAGEIFLVPDQTFEAIKDMEEAANYKTAKTTTQKGEDVVIFYYKPLLGDLSEYKIDKY